MQKLKHRLKLSFTFFVQVDHVDQTVNSFTQQIALRTSSTVDPLEYISKFRILFRIKAFDFFTTFNLESYRTSSTDSLIDPKQPNDSGYFKVQTGTDTIEKTAFWNKRLFELRNLINAN